MLSSMNIFYDDLNDGIIVANDLNNHQQPNKIMHHFGST